MSRLTPGTIIEKRNTFDRMLDMGGKGIVYLALDGWLGDTPAAIKKLANIQLAQVDRAWQLQFNRMTYILLVLRLRSSQWKPSK